MHHPSNLLVLSFSKITFNIVDSLPWDVQVFLCNSRGTIHDRDGNGATNIKAEGIKKYRSWEPGLLPKSGT